MSRFSLTLKSWPTFSLYCVLNKVLLFTGLVKVLKPSFNNNKEGTVNSNVYSSSR